jgi:hypothetical protein
LNALTPCGSHVTIKDTPFAAVPVGARDVRVSTLSVKETKALRLMPIHLPSFRGALRNRTWGTLLLGALGAAVLAGCQPNDEISHYQMPREPAAAMPNYKTPPDWKKLKGDELSLVAYQVGDGDKTAKITITTLSGQAGGALLNVNRWRGQLLLPAINQTQLETELNKENGKIDVGGLKAKYVDITGKAVERTGEKPTLKDDRILGVILPSNGQTWFFKMRGPPDMVGAKQKDFEEFVRSVRFDGGNHE